VEVSSGLLGPSEAVFVTPEDIVRGNPRLNLAFTVQLFNAYPQLDAPSSGSKLLLPVPADKEIWNEGQGETAWVVVAGQPGVRKEKVSLLWANGSGAFRLQDSAGHWSTTLKKHELQVIPTDLWELGLLISARVGFAWGPDVRGLAETALFFAGVDRPAELAAFFEPLRRFSASTLVTSR